MTSVVCGGACVVLRVTRTIRGTPWRHFAPSAAWHSRCGGPIAGAYTRCCVHDTAALTSSATDVSDRGATDADSSSSSSSSHDIDHDTDSTAAPATRAVHAELVALLRDAVPAPSTEAIKSMLRDAKSSKDVRQLLEQVVYTHALCYDVLNGHGFRVFVLQLLSTVVTRVGCMYEWFDCMDRFRQLGFVLTRTFAADGFTAIRYWLSMQFEECGRTPRLVSDGLAHTRELLRWCHEDALVFDHVLYTRIVFLLTLMVSFFDRQNVYRALFPADFCKRDGVVVEWVLAHERCVDFDECVLQCDAVLEEVLTHLHHDLPSRPSFSLLYRLVDYYFATDNVDKMLAVMEDAHACGIDVAESSTAKLMQLACALNHPRVPELFLRWRVALPQCVLAAPDISRLLFYYARAGGGLPCALCGEPYNHRNVCVYHWLRTPAHQRRCPALRMAMQRKGELEECTALAQNRDWSAEAFRLWALSQSRSIAWGSMEWRGFMLCCLFSPRALEARALVDAHLPADRMDSFVRAVYIRLLRHHAPEQAGYALHRWRVLATEHSTSPTALQECLMAAAAVTDPRVRLEHVRQAWEAIVQRDTYVMPFTRRYLQRCLRELASASSSKAGETGDRTANADDVATTAATAATAATVQLLREIVRSRPRHMALLGLRDSAADYLAGTFRKNVYQPQIARTPYTSRVDVRRSRWAVSPGTASVGTTSTA